MLLVATLLTVLSLVPPRMMGMRFAFDISTMLPQEIPAARAFTQAVVDFDSVDEAVVVFRLREGMHQVNDAGRVAEEIAERLRTDSRIKAAFCRKLTDTERDYLLEEVLPARGLMLLSPERLQRVKELLEPGRMGFSVKKTKRRVFSSVNMPDEQVKMICHDVLGVMSVFEDALSSLGTKKDESDAGDYIVAEIGPEKRDLVRDDAKALLLLIIQPRQPAQSASFSRDIMQLIRRVTEEVVEQRIPPKARESIAIEYGGGYEIASRYQERVNETLLNTLFVSLIGVIALFGWCFKRPGVLIYIGLPLVMVVAWTIGVGWVLFGQLNIVSCAFAAVLVGLGVDYAIHIYNRYVEERKQEKSVEESFKISLTQTGWAVFIGMVTTSLAFLALNATRFRQLSEFGALAGLGIALSVPGMLFVLPALITLRNRLRTEHPRVIRPTPFLLPQVAGFVERNRKAVLFIALALAVASVLRVTMHEGALKFDKRISSLRPKERAFELGGEIARAFSNRNPNKLMLLAYGENERAALEKAAELAGRCKELKKRGLILDYESVMRYLPSPSEQEASLAVLRTIDFEKALADFRRALDREGLSEEPFWLTIKLLKRHAELVKQDDPIILPSDFYDTPVGKWARRLATRRKRRLDLRDPIPAEVKLPVTLAKPAIDRNGRSRRQAGEVLTRQDLIDMGPDGTNPPTGVHDANGEPIRYAWVKRITILEEGWTVKANVYPPILESSRTADLNITDDWLGKVRAGLGLPANEEDTTSRGAFLTGTSLLAHKLADVVKEDFWRVSIAVFGVAIVVLSVFYYRHPLRVVYTLLPIVLGLIYLFGIMSYFAIDFNFVNVLAIPIIIGLGVDNGIHLVNRFYESGRHVRPMVEDTGRAIMVTSLTSMIGFGSLAVSGYEGITSMGVLSILALASSLVASLVVFPSILATFSPPEQAPDNPEQDRD